MIPSYNQERISAQAESGWSVWPVSWLAGAWGTGLPGTGAGCQAFLLGLARAHTPRVGPGTCLRAALCPGGGGRHVGFLASLRAPCLSAPASPLCH